MIKFISYEDTLDLVETLSEEFGVEYFVKDRGLLDSALNQAKASFGGEDLHKTIFDKASAYLFHITNNHALNDSNKRLGLLVTLFFLQENGLTVNTSEKDLENLTLAVAKGEADKPHISKWLEKHS